MDCYVNKVGTHMRAKQFVVSTVSGMTFALGANAGTPSPTTPAPAVQSASFDHLADGQDGKTLSLQLNPGDQFTVVLKHTCKSYFQLLVNGTKNEGADQAAEASAVATAAATTLTCDPTDEISSPTLTYQAGYTGYQVVVSRVDKATDPVPVNVGSTKLYPTTDFVIVPSSDWTATFSGGVTVSSLTSPKYSLQPVAGTSGSAASYTVVRNKSSEDAVTPGLAAFVTVSNRDWNTANGKLQFGLTFGIGTNTGSKVQYYPGVSLKTGVMIITLGPNIGTIDTLPAGLHEGSTTSQQNALGTLATRTAVGGFLAFSFTFSATSAAAQKSFLGGLAPASGGT
jgi:hypothetical protein